MKKSKIIAWCGSCFVGAMKSISFQVVKNGGGYVRSAFATEATQAGRPSTRGLVIAGILLALTATFVGLMLLGS
jgi:hypothetical protein